MSGTPHTMTPRRASLKTASTPLFHPQRTLFSYLREQHELAAVTDQR